MLNPPPNLDVSPDALDILETMSFEAAVIWGNSVVSGPTALMHLYDRFDQPRGGHIVVFGITGNNYHFSFDIIEGSPTIWAAWID